MNGQAITKRYRVTDAETGEAVAGAYVLVPDEDSFASTCMFGYASLCGLTDSQRRAVAMSIDPQRDKDHELLDAIAEDVELISPDKVGSESVEGDDFERQAALGAGANGSVEYARDLWRSMGYEPCFVAMRPIGEEEQERAEARMHERREAEAAHNREALVLAREAAKERGLDPDSVAVVIQRRPPALKPFDVSVFPARAASRTRVE